MRWIVLTVTFCLLFAAEARACGADSDCLLGDRTYRISVPEGPRTGPYGALIIAHGYGGSAKAEMANKALRGFAHKNGMALVAPNAVGEVWMIPHLPDHPPEKGAREYAFFDALVDDLATRHSVDPDRIVMSGFSAGAMLVWNLACYRGQTFAAYLPIAGTYWDPIPENCAGPVPHLVHIHGTADDVVPMAGRPVWEMRQGDVNVAMDRAMKAGAFGDPSQTEEDDLTCRHRKNQAGTVLALCTHPGGHVLRIKDLAMALKLFDQHGAFKRKPPPQGGDQG